MTAPLPIVSTVTLGTAGASTAVVANLTSDPAQWDPVYVTLSENYVQATPPGFPFGAPLQPYTQRGTYTNGQRAQFWRVEANALVTAGAGVLS